ncbi:Adenosylcobalamin biosynthesis, ATP:cob(I)alamin adenosyltransferase CobA/CobO/ButR [Moorella glycerini]|uniref:Cob(I)yrinic acid a,c-diamide adenosyltransferase n=1 Tax=Neomoorella stamsii TaxID=1266720 RepID=A0A9X7J460_9FIRM|nr:MULTISPECIES: cob(I)yrinic acid a,c-diamide adenosyltransferase [Moorella]PRR73050.1 Cob(I)yrinic acid a,c-diamide adenosyltransferase [Moorella stamsii]CEP69620.1 Adenosylcobalamin biosynthesis, ATP:cob(I)alamin adenosyltransferase CobA/CobO/ButR [Moorella glycerini]
MAGLEQGLVQVYTGEAKGKSTAAFGLALRACGHGLKVLIVQFMKTPDYGEHKAFPRLAPEVEVKTFGRKGFIHRGGARPEDYEQARAALAFAREAMLGGRVDILILDEINNALYFGLLTEEEVLAFLAERPPQVEVVLTGRNAPAGIIAAADLVTEMRQVKHPYEKGIKARKGIEY